MINFSIVIINDISDRAMIDKEEEGEKRNLPFISESCTLMSHITWEAIVQYLYTFISQ